MNTYSVELAAQKMSGAPDKPAASRGLYTIYTIGIAEQKIVQAPDRLSTLGLGSCVGLVLYDAVSKTAGMVHIMLPSMPPGAPAANVFKFADTAIPEMIRLMTNSGCLRGRLTAKLAGGAHMFNAGHNIDFMNIGDRNVQMCKQMIGRHGIPIAAVETGGSCGRSIEFCCETGMLQIRTVAPQRIRLI